MKQPPEDEQNVRLLVRAAGLLASLPLADMTAEYERAAVLCRETDPVLWAEHGHNIEMVLALLKPARDLAQAVRNAREHQAAGGSMRALVGQIISKMPDDQPD